MRHTIVDPTTAIVNLFDRNEQRVISELAEQSGLSFQAVLKQALRAYQLSLSDVSLPSKLAEENERLREGDFTEEEFQNLCHCIPEDDRDRFFTGCAEFQRSLFGTSDRDELITRIRILCMNKANELDKANNTLPLPTFPERLSNQWKAQAYRELLAEVDKL